MKILVIMFCSHFIADFLLQSREMGKRKSTEFRVLMTHISIQLNVMYLVLWYFIELNLALHIAFCNMAVHGVIDWYIWRGYKLGASYRIKKGIDKHLYETVELKEGPQLIWKYWEDHWFYTTIGFDQLLHGLTLIILWSYFI